jgi:hypothetical protein
MKTSDFLTLTAVKTMLGKKTGAVKAEIAGTQLSAVAPTSGEALERLQKMLAFYDANGSAREYHATKNGKVLCLYATPHGWCYDIFSNDGQQPTTCLMPCKDRQLARQAVLSHVKQYNEN